MNEVEALKERLQALLATIVARRKEAGNHLPGDVKTYHLREAGIAEREIIAAVPAILDAISTHAYEAERRGMELVPPEPTEAMLGAVDALELNTALFTARGLIINAWPVIRSAMSQPTQNEGGEG